MASVMAHTSPPVDFTVPYDRSAVKDKTALITGGASGIGAGIAQELANAGATVIIADLNIEAGTNLSSSLTARGHRSLFTRVDVTSWESQVSAFKQAVAFSPTRSVDVVIASAGLFGGPLLTQPPFARSDDPDPDPLPPKSETQQINVNLIGPLYTAMVASYYWRRQAAAVPAAAAATSATPADRHIIFIGSNLAYFPVPSFFGYTASKWGLRGLWKCLRSEKELARVLRTNFVAPHIVRTPMTNGLDAMCDSRGIEMVEIRDVVAVLMRLCCIEGIRGRAVHVNPGGSWFDVGDDLEVGGELQHHNEGGSPFFELIRSRILMELGSSESIMRRLSLFSILSKASSVTLKDANRDDHHITEDSGLPLRLSLPRYRSSSGSDAASISP